MHGLADARSEGEAPFTSHSKRMRSVRTSFGSAAPIDPVTGITVGSPSPVRSVTTANDDVMEILPDGDGGWFLVGYFQEVGQLPRTALARIDSEGQVMPWTPGGIYEVDSNGNHFPASVTTAWRVGDTLYLGGKFGEVGGQIRNNLAAIDIPTATVTDWNPLASGQVTTMTSIGNRWTYWSEE